MYRIALTVCLLLVLMVGAHADTVLFVPPTVTGPNPLPSSIMAGPIAVDGFYQNGSTWAASPLWLRTQVNDRGLGVCSPGESCATGGGDVNELDNAGNAELIRLTLPSGFTWQSVQVSSLDRNGLSTTTSSTLWEHGQLWGTNDANPADLASATLLCNFVQGGAANNACTYGGGPEPTLTLSSGNSFQYLFFRPFNWEAPGTNNDYLVYGASITRPTSTPEPASMLLLGAGLAAIAVRRKKN